MQNNSGGDANSRIGALLKREAALKEAITKEKIRQLKANAKLEAREAAIVGDALCKYAAKSLDFKLMLKQVLASAVTEDAARKFLANRGWL